MLSSSGAGPRIDPNCARSSSLCVHNRKQTQNAGLKKKKEIHRNLITQTKTKHLSENNRRQSPRLSFGVLTNHHLLGVLSVILLFWDSRKFQNPRVGSCPLPDFLSLSPLHFPLHFRPPGGRGNLFKITSTAGEQKLDRRGVVAASSPTSGARARARCGMREVRARARAAPRGGPRGTRRRTEHTRLLGSWAAGYTNQSFPIISISWIFRNL